MKIYHRTKQTFLLVQKNLAVYTWWEIVVFVVGTVSFFSLLVVFLLPTGNGIAKMKYTGEIPAVDSPEFVRTISGSLNLPIRQGNDVQILNNGDVFLKSLLTDIDDAKSSINIMTYIWKDGAMSNQIIAHLDKKVKEGVEVRIMYDAFGSKSVIPKKQFKDLTTLGGKVVAFHSFTIVPWQLVKNQKRNHRRAIIIDGKIGYTGGMAVDDLWLGNARNPKEYRDMMFRATGTMAGDIQGAFGELWTSMTGEVLNGESFYPAEEIANNKNKLVYTMLMSTPSPDSLAIQKFFLFSVLGARKTIHITTPYFLPDQALRDSLIKKAKEGVDVQVLVPSTLNDSSSVYYSSHYSYEELLKAGIKIHEYTPTFIHEKSMVIDGVWSVVGSANLDNLSRKMNEEDIFGIESKTFSTELESNFQTDVAKADEVDLTNWKKRSLWQHGRELFARTFFQQY